MWLIRKRWVVSECDKDYAADVAEEFSVNPLTAYLLVARGITDELEIEEFLDTTSPLMADPFMFADMRKAADRINEAIDRGERIAVFGDYDCDGVTATALLYSFLCGKNADCMRYIPDRLTEGYGLNCEAVRYLKEQGVKLIVTVDNGVSAVEEAKLIKELGMELIVTDHHKVGDTLPEAVAVVDPHRADCQGEFKELSGVGVAFKLAAAIENGNEDIVLDEYADLVAIGTIGDVVTLRGENRILVRNGLEMINSAPSTGIKALLEKAGAGDKKLSATGVAFTLCPRINAAGRMGSAYKALDLLLCDDYERALDMAEEMRVMNQKRQKTESEIFTAACSKFAENPAIVNEKIIVVSGKGWHQGVAGIVASRIVERYGKPTIVICEDEKSFDAKGSARSVEGFSIFDAIESCSDCLTHFGGHTLAAGVGLDSRKIDEFRYRINEYAADIEMPFPVQHIDCRLKNPASVNTELLCALDALEPFGAGNAQPAFGLFGVTLEDINPIGDGRHIRLTVSKDNARASAAFFGMSEADFPYRRGDKVDLAVNLERNIYNGEERVSINVRNIRPSGTDEMTVLKSLRLYDKILAGDRLTPEQARFAYPDREEMINVFRFIKSEKPLENSYELMCLHMGAPASFLCKTAVAVNAMTEMGIAAADNAGRLYAPSVNGKVNLEDASVMKRLRSLFE